MQTKHRKRMKLDRTTLRRLNQRDLRQVGGVWRTSNFRFCGETYVDCTRDILTKDTIETCG